MSNIVVIKEINNYVVIINVIPVNNKNDFSGRRQHRLMSIKHRLSRIRSLYNAKAHYAVSQIFALVKPIPVRDSWLATRLHARVPSSLGSRPNCETSSSYIVLLGLNYRARCVLVNSPKFIAGARWCTVNFSTIFRLRATSQMLPSLYVICEPWEIYAEHEIT